MSGNMLSQIDRVTVLDVVSRMPDQFYTKDVSSHPDMIASHPDLSGHSHYHAIVGKYLKRLEDRRGQTALEEVSSRHSRGSLWRKRGTLQPQPLLRPSQDSPTHQEKQAVRRPVDLGPQYAMDSPFAARMRLHQSWYRMTELNVPCGTGPRPDHASLYGNMLRKEDGCRGLNFLTPRIWAVVQQRLAERTGTIDPFRLQCNMLSSQPMCFNLFGLLAADPELATALWRRLFPGEVERVTRVLIEYAPTPASDHLADRTAFDAFVEHRCPDGSLAFTGIETKLTESFSQKLYDRAEYRRWMEKEPCPWRPDAKGAVSDIQHNQLWRGHLLAVAMLRHPASPYARGRFMLVRHPGDGDCAAVTSGYRGLLTDGDDTFADMPLDTLASVWESAGLSGEAKQWLVAFRLRYLDLDRSQAVANARLR